MLEENLKSAENAAILADSYNKHKDWPYMMNELKDILSYIWKNGVEKGLFEIDYITDHKLWDPTIEKLKDYKYKITPIFANSVSSSNKIVGYHIEWPKELLQQKNSTLNC